MLIKSSTSTPSFAKNKIDRHLRDINDTISEEDIKNVTATQVPENRLIINNGIIEIVDSIQEETGDPVIEKIESPWNIL